MAWWSLTHRAAWSQSRQPNPLATDLCQTCKTWPCEVGPPTLFLFDSSQRLFLHRPLKFLHLGTKAGSRKGRSRCPSIGRVLTHSAAASRRVTRSWFSHQGLNRLQPALPGCGGPDLEQADLGWSSLATQETTQERAAAVPAQSICGSFNDY